MDNVKQFIAWALSHAKQSSVPAGAKLFIPLEKVGTAGEWEYLYGTTGIVCTQSKLNSKYRSYYKPHGWSLQAYQAATKNWVAEKRIVCDCQGLCDYYLHIDTNAKGNYAKFCTSKGSVKSITRKYVIGEAVFKGSSPSSINHVGFICGFMPDGEPLVVEEKGLRYGCVVTRLSSTAWTYRGLMTKKFEYDDTPTQDTAPSTPSADGVYHGQITGNVYLRTAPSTTSSKVMVLRKGMKVLVTPYNDSWVQVATYVNGLSRTGYASVKYIRAI